MSKPTFPQMEHFFRLVEEGKITSANLQAFLENPSRFPAGLPVFYKQSLGLMKLIELAVGPDNLGNINPNITPERFPLKGTGVRAVNLRVEAYLDGETSEEAAKRLKEAGHKLGNTGDLAAFLHDHPDKVEEYDGVFAISEDSRWADPGGQVCVPYAYVSGAYRNFSLYDFRSQLSSGFGVLVLCE